MKRDTDVFAWALGLGFVGLGGLAILYATNLPQAALGFYAVALFMAMLVRVTR